jgi:cell division septum initiation protein DivIVA
VVKFSKSLFGYKPTEVIQELDTIDKAYQQQVEELRHEMEEARSELRKAEEQKAKLEKAVHDYMNRERIVAEVMVTAQMNAQKIEEQARERARVMLETTEEELRRKMQELDFVRLKVTRFKEDFREVLDKYRVSLENVKETPEDISFTPTLVKEKNSEAANNK